MFDDSIDPNTLSELLGAVENTRTESASKPNPEVGVAESCGCWNTPFTDIINCDARVTFA